MKMDSGRETRLVSERAVEGGRIFADHIPRVASIGTRPRARRHVVIDPYFVLRRRWVVVRDENGGLGIGQIGSVTTPLRAGRRDFKRHGSGSGEAVVVNRIDWNGGEPGARGDRHRPGQGLVIHPAAGGATERVVHDPRPGIWTVALRPRHD